MIECEGGTIHIDVEWFNRRFDILNNMKELYSDTQDIMTCPLPYKQVATVLQYLQISHDERGIVEWHTKHLLSLLRINTIMQVMQYFLIKKYEQIHPLYTYVESLLTILLDFKPLKINNYAEAFESHIHWLTSQDALICNFHWICINKSSDLVYQQLKCI